MSDSESDHITQDSRIPCKYGDKCYQKNPVHHSKYKHPSKKSKRKSNSFMKSPKRTKLDDKTIKSPNNVSTTPQDDSQKQELKPIGNLLKESNEEYISSSDSEQNDETLKQQSSNNEAKITAENKNEGDNKVKVDKKIFQDESKVDQKGKLPDPHKLEEDSKSENIIEKISERTELINPKTFIKAKFLVEMPDDFYKFWELCKQLNQASPSDAFKEVGLKLVGPYDVLAGKFKNTKKSPDEYLRHWRYYYDTPEVFTIIKGDDKTGYHIGYFYDSPNEVPSFLVSNHASKDGVFIKMGDNIFAAVSLYLEEYKKIGDPFKKMHVGKLLSTIKAEAEKLELNLFSHSKKIKEREFKIVAKTLNKIGIVVPYNKKTQLGYRSLAMQDKELMTLLSKLEKATPEQKSMYLSDLQPVLTFANIALDECDFGTGVKLGWELMYHGIDTLNSTISQFLANSYRLLNKEAFAKIAEAHMRCRKKGCDLSVV